MSCWKVLLCAGAAMCMYAQQPEKMSARELFYTPVPKRAPEAQPPPVEPPKPQVVEAPKPPVASAKRPPARKKAPGKSTPPAPPAVTSQSPPETAVAQTQPPPQQPVAPPDKPVLPGGGQVALAQYAPLGVRYSLLKSSPGGYQEVDADTTFHAGDSIRLSVEANDRAYLYLVARGSSGTWKVLFPSPEIDGGSNVVERERQFTIPQGGRFTFDEQPGVERLFLVLSRNPVSDLDGLIYSLTPGAAPSAPERQKQLLIAQNITNIDDALVERIRANMQSRDLVFEKVDEKTSGDRKEKAIYIVNPDRNPNARLVADISLKHE